MAPSHDDARTQLAILTAQAGAQSTLALGLLTAASVLGGALLALGADLETSDALLGASAVAGICAATVAGGTLTVRIAPPPWPYDPMALDRYLFALRRVVELRSRGLS